MRTPKYKALVIATHGLLISIDGTLLDQQPVELERMLDAFKPATEQRYMYVELYYCLGEVTGNNIDQIVAATDRITDAKRLNTAATVIMYFTRKGGKPYQSPPVGRTWLPA